MTAEADEPVILVESDADVIVLTLNRAEARNAINLRLATELCRQMGAAQDAGAIVITGSGSAFCAGLDLRETGTQRLSDLPRCARTIAASRVPVIAAVNGPAVTAGFEIALACDFIVASERATFADTHLAVRVYPGPVLVDLPRRVGMAWARELSLTGRFIDASVAERIGLVNHVEPHDQLMAAAVDLARRISGYDRTMVRTMREDWAATYPLTLDVAHRVHLQRATTAGYRSTTSAELADQGSDLLARRHRGTD
jgi:enoyl-CoA hydratase